MRKIPRLEATNSPSLAPPFLRKKAFDVCSKLLAERKVTSNLSSPASEYDVIAAGEFYQETTTSTEWSKFRLSPTTSALFLVARRS